MNLRDANFNRDYVLESVSCRLSIQETIVTGVGQITLLDDDFCFSNQGKQYKFQILDDSNRQQTLSFLKKGFHCIAEKTDDEHSQIFHLRIVFFASKERWGPLSVLASEQNLDRLESRVSRSMKSISDIFSLQIGQTKCFLYSIRDASKPNKKEESSENNESNTDEYDEFDALTSSDDGDIQKKAEDKQNSVFRIYGENCMIQVRLLGEDMDAYLSVEKVIYNVNNIPCLRLGIGTLEFSTQREYASKKVRETLRSTPGYISLWDQYSDMEGEFLFRKVREVGVLSWKPEGISAEQKGILVPVKPECVESLRLIQAGDYIAFHETIPPYLQDNDLTWKEWKEGSFSFKPTSETDADSTEETLRYVRSVRNRHTQVKVLKNTGSALVLDAQSLPKGYASLSIIGDQSQIKRRERSRSKIRNGLASNPNLGYIIEGIPYLDSSNSSSRKHYEPLSPLVLDKIFTYDPTPTQRRAIDIALNTPDIAIIQGPPGTGKTTVITAIIERLNELADKSKFLRGEVLVTSLQHDAVKNIQERLTVNSLPTVKFGTSSRQDQEEDFDIITDSWCEENARKLRERHPELRQSEAERELNKLIDRYIRTPNDGNALAFLRYAIGVTTSKETSAELHDLIRELEIYTRDDYGDIVRILRRLRTNSTSFADDGPERAMDAYVALEQLLVNSQSSKDALRVLQQAAMADRDTVSDDLLCSLEEVQDDLLARCFPPPFYRQPTPRKSILTICEKIQKEARSPGNEESRILAEYLDELEHNTSAVRESLKNYCFVFTATLQQSEGKDILEAKSISRDKDVEYDTVIVDEAARANPGDLMIPLARARSKIILVGDHRQLPHMYDEEIFEELRNAGSTVNEADIKISLFQHLFENAKKLEIADGIQRTVTLDAQYRMHPVLGQFISQQFYESHDEQFASPLPESKFRQELVPVPVEWLNLPPSRGKEDRNAQKSRYRMCEVRLIVNKIKEFLDNPTAEKLNFGVISFYSAQVQKIRSMLEESGEKISEAIRSGRLRVGSVDSFQGMEFDVIFLSVVRTGAAFSKINLQQLERDSNYKADVGLRTYGFLTSENRLCVALSRQKKLLIIVGDSSMFVGGIAERVANCCIPAMPALYKLCQEKGVVEEC